MAMINATSSTSLKSADGNVRQRLLAAALELLQTEGFQALTQVRVAKVADVRQSHLTYYFRTRNDLLKAVVEEGCSAMHGMIGSGIRPGTVTLAKFRDALLSVTDDQSMPRLMIALTVASDEDPTLKVWLAEFDRGIQAHLAVSLRQLGMEPSATDLTLFHAAMIGTSMLCLHNSDAAWPRKARKIVRLAFDRMVANSRFLPVAKQKSGRT